MADGDFEPRGGPTPGACSADKLIETMRGALCEAAVAMALAKSMPAVAAEYDFEPAYKKVCDALLASKPPLCRADAQ